MCAKKATPPPASAGCWSEKPPSRQLEDEPEAEEDQNAGTSRREEEDESVSTLARGSSTK